MLCFLVVMSHSAGAQHETREICMRVAYSGSRCKGVTKSYQLNNSSLMRNPCGAKTRQGYRSGLLQRVLAFSQAEQVNTIQLPTMPGLLQTQAEHFTKTKYVMALCAEFLGSMLFTFTGSALLSVALADPKNPNVVLAALGNAAGITVAGKGSLKRPLS